MLGITCPHCPLVLSYALPPEGKITALSPTTLIATWLIVTIVFTVLGSTIPGHNGGFRSPCMTMPSATIGLVPALTVLLKLLTMVTSSPGSAGPTGGGGRFTGGACPWPWPGVGV